MEMLTPPNIAAYSAQVAIVVALATVIAWLLRIDAPSVRYAFWRAVFVVCLLLPFLQERQVATVADVVTTVSTSAAASEPVQSRTSAAAPRFDPWMVALPVLLAGVALRGVWLALCFARLRRLRTAGAAATDIAMHRELQEAIGTRAEIRYVSRQTQPVTFGLLRPVVLLPSALADRSEDIQRAVLTHELFHVKRRDWGWLLVEEIVFAVLWFNPAIWWLVSRVHLAREVVVDELVVLATGRRRAYVEALMAFADDTSLAPVAAFGGRPQLFNRIVLLSKEARMSSHRVVLSCAVAVAVLSVGTWTAVGAFPLVAGPPEPQAARFSSPGPLEQQARPITRENPVPQRTNYEAPDYPVEARVANARGSVTLIITVDELGRIAEVRRTGLSVVTPTASARFSNAKPEDVKRFVVNNNAAESEALRAAAFAMEEAALRAIDQWRYEPPASAPISFPIVITFNQDGEVTSARGRGASSARTMTGGVQAPSSTIRVGGNVKTPTKIKDVRPVYPQEARAAKVSGMVIAELLVGPDGAVQDAKILRSIPLLDQAALDAVMQWVFTPTLLNGQAVPVIMTVTVNFTLTENGLPVSREATHEDALRRGTVSVMPGTARRVMPRVIKEVRPVYPDIARNAGVQGTVEVEVVIGTDGHVTGARVVRGLPMLNEAALDAVRQWAFKPIPEPFTTTIELTFSLRR